MDFAICHLSHSHPPSFSLVRMFTLTPLSSEHPRNWASKYKFLICCKNIYRLTWQSFDESRLKTYHDIFSPKYPWSARRGLPHIRVAPRDTIWLQWTDRRYLTKSNLTIRLSTFCFQGYYADTDADCQAFHICAPDGSSSLLKYSFLCPNGTLFNQQYFICDWWFNVDCSQAPTFYALNADIAAAAAAANDNREGRNLDVAEITDLKNLGDFGGQGKGRKFSG